MPKKCSPVAPASATGADHDAAGQQPDLYTKSSATAPPPDARTGKQSTHGAAPSSKADGRGKEKSLPNGLAGSEPPPWPDPVHGAALLDDIVRAVRRHVILPKPDAGMVALWVLHAATIDAHQHSPRLAITSPVPNCGKTTLCFAIGQLLGVRVRSNITIAAFFRTVAKQGPETVILDEADTFLSSDNRAGIGILNSGHGRAGALVSRVEHTANGGMEPHDFSTWGPVVFGLIDQLPAASLKSRCLGVLLKRKRPSETVERLGDEDAELAALRTRALGWARVNLTSLRKADPHLPAGLYNRDQDNWRPLLAVADTVGGAWPARARKIALALNGLAQDPSESVMLLADIRRVFAARGVDRIETKELVTALCWDEERPWHDFHERSFRITDRQLAKLLAPFDIRPETVRIGARTPKGYLLAKFADAFERYLLPLPGPDVADGVADAVAFAEAKNPSEINVVADVAAEGGGMVERDDGATGGG